MTKIAYKQKRFNQEHLALIATADEIMVEYAADGFALTLRQLYYQFVARGFIENTVQSYKRLGGVINDARMAGMLDWEGIEDRTRNVDAISHWADAQAILRSAGSSFQLDLWHGQDSRPEVWVEKEALVGVIEPVCKDLRIDSFACRGYTSQSEQWRAAHRILDRWREERQGTVIFHLGDHDPSGIDMTRDNIDRLKIFVKRHSSSCPVKVVRLALNMDQVEHYNPPPNPAKATDARFAAYAARFGDESWELDALDPKTIDALIRDNVNALLDGGDRERYEDLARQESGIKSKLHGAADQWDNIEPGL